MRIPKPHFYRFPTAGLFTDYRNLPPTELNVYRAARAFFAFADMNVLRLGGLMGAWPMLPVNLLTETLPAWASYNQAATTAFHTPALDQFRQCVRLALNDGPSPTGYYLAGIAEHKGAPEIGNYIHDQFHETLVEFCRYAVEQVHGVQRELDNKLAFEKNCREFDLPCIETFLRVKPDGNVEPTSTGAMDRAQLASSLFIKPIRGSQGQGTERWDADGGAYTASDNRRHPDFDGLLQHLKSRAGKANVDLLVQQVLVNPSRIRAFGGRALSTVRLVTFRTSDGAIRPVQAGTRIAADAEAVVDNYHAGGIYFHVDYRTGEIGTGTSMNFPTVPEYLTRPPRADVPLTGNMVEGWTEISRLALDLHEKLTMHTIGGWDIAMTDNGPVAVECNSVPGMPAPRQRPFSGFLQTEYADLLRAEILTFLDHLAPAGSRFRFGAEGI
ncbi:MAG: sugar-transfer associated ATP-grasp domain-containing protein [Pseudomonadota bacterium]